MNQIEKIFGSCSKNIALLGSRGSFIEIKYSGRPEALFNITETIYQGDNTGDQIAISFSEALKLVTYYRGAVDGNVLFRDMLLQIGSALSLAPFAGADPGNVFFTDMGNSGLDVNCVTARLSGLFRDRFGNELGFNPVQNNVAVAVLDKRLQETRKFYLEELGDWLAQFISQLQDDLSRTSFLTYLRQRILAKIFSDSDICYPVKPPAATMAWRKMRDNLQYDYPELQDVAGEPLERRHYKLVYDYQQYAITEGPAPAPKDVVVDAGAFVGDTATWFSSRVGESGTVFSFEPSLRNARRGKMNMERLGIHNVKFFPFALSDRSGEATIMENESSGSASRIIADDNHHTGGSAIKVTTLDDMRSELGKINFIKADIEGSEMAMLRGAAKTIKEDAPVCAICLYHKRDDFWQIPQYLLELRPDYKFWFRCEAEPVLFAKCEGDGHA